MLTLVKSDDAVPIVGIYGAKNKKPEATVYFTHDMQKDNQNVATAAGVLQLHKSEIKREFHMNDEDFKEVCRMIDAEEEPEQGDALRHEFWQRHLTLNPSYTIVMYQIHCKPISLKI